MASACRSAEFVKTAFASVWQARMAGADNDRGYTNLVHEFVRLVVDNCHLQPTEEVFFNCFKAWADKLEARTNLRTQHYITNVLIPYVGGHIRDVKLDFDFLAYMAKTPHLA